jgi:lipoyl(octanoyl) transferase
MPRADPIDKTFTRADGAPATWAVSASPVDYIAAVAAMEARAAAIADGAAGEMVWLLEHPALYTAGVSAKASDLLDPSRFPVFESGRGGQYTYHGPGQRVAYVMLDLGARRKDTRGFVTALEGWIVDTLDQLGVMARVVPGRVGVWAGDDKIAAIGVKLKRWVSFHGVSLNVAPDLEHFSGIVPCGIGDAGVTSLERLGRAGRPALVDAALKAAFFRMFGPVADGDPPL